MRSAERIVRREIRNFCGVFNDSGGLKSVKRRFLGDGPFLSDAAQLLLSEVEQGGDGPLDLRGLLVILPGREAGRHLRRLLVDAAAKRGYGLLPPRIATHGRLEEICGASRYPLASGLEDRIAWVQSIRECPADLLPLLGLDPDNLPTSALLPLAQLLAHLSYELRRDGVTLGQAAELAAPHDPAAALRLRAVERIEALRSARLQGHGLTAAGAFDSDGCDLDLKVVLIGILEVPSRMRQWLQKLDSVEVWIDNREQYSERYDDFGCPIPEQWEALPCPAPADLLVADEPRALAATLLQEIDHNCPDGDPDGVTIGLVHQEMLPWLQESFRHCGVPLHIAGGTRHASTSCGRLLVDLTTAVESGSSHSVAAMARHPAILRNLSGDTDRHGKVIDPLESIDRWSSRRQPISADDPQAPVAVKTIEQALQPLRTGNGSCTDRIDQLVECLGQLVGLDDFKQPALPRSGLGELISAVDQLRVAGKFDSQPMSGADVIAILADLLDETRVADGHGTDGVAVLGWLELPFDPAEVLIVTGLSEGQISPAPPGDSLLPHGVREELGLAGPRQQYARDTHILHSLLKPRRKTIIALCARDGEGNPLLPSRLLLEGPDGLDRLARFLDQDQRSRLHLPDRGAVTESPESLGVPKVILAPDPPSIAVTAFSDYIEDPALFHLNRQLKLRECHDRDLQLNRLEFGNLIHHVLEEYGKDPAVRDLTDEGDIREVLHALLDRYRAQRIATPARAAVAVQLELARTRLDAWATSQAQQRALGWRIVDAEVDLDSDRCRITVPEGELGVTGRIDRIDFHEQDRLWRLLDYKSGDSGKQPDKEHRRGTKNNKRWVKLQLPLYLEFADQLGIPGLDENSTVEVGYFLLPDTAARTGVEMAHWTEDDLDDARSLAKEVVSGILQGGEVQLSMLKTPWDRALAGVTVEEAARLDGINEQQDEEDPR